jgi:HD domain-containing protein
MVRMSDLVRGTVEEPSADTQRAASPPAPTPERRPTRFADLGAVGGSTPEQSASQGRAPGETPPAVEPVAPAPRESGGADGLFQDLRALLVEVPAVIERRGEFPWRELTTLADSIVESLERSAELFSLVNCVEGPGPDYLSFHQARVAVIAARIARSMGYDHRQLVELTMAGALIDVGLWREAARPVGSGVGAARRAGWATGGPPASAAPDDETYRSHPQRSAELLRAWSPPSDRMVEAVRQHHERERGQGWPQGLEGASIHPDAKVLGLADTYATLTAPDGGPAVPPHEAVASIVRSKDDLFSPAVVKAFLSEVSLFPPGTMVRLSSGEVGRVVAVNRRHPLRPQVQILVDGRGQRLPAAKLLDLAEAPFLHIVGPNDGHQVAGSRPGG